MTVKWLKETGHVHNVELQLLSYHSNQMEKDHYFAEIATSKNCKIVLDDTKE